MIKCGEKCQDICDFCRHWKDGKRSEITGFGHCGKHQKETYFGDRCDDFHCYKAEEE